MQPCTVLLVAATIVLAVILIVATVNYLCSKRGDQKSGYLVDPSGPYIDLDEPGVRGSPYALCECVN